MIEQKRVPVTKEGLERVKAELEELKTVRRDAISRAIAEARSHGDLRENAAYDAARHDHTMNEKRISDIETMIRSADVIDPDDRPGKGDVVGVGSVVIVDIDGDEERYTIVGAIEAKPKDGLISNESPICKALMGKRAGDKATVMTPGGTARITIRRIER